MLLVAAFLLAGCLPDEGTVTDKHSQFVNGKWSYFVSVDGNEYSVSAYAFNTCDVGEHLVKGECP